MKGINEFTAYQIRHWDCDTETIDGWKLARPIGQTGLIRRCKKAWKVFTGKADVLVWHRQ
jgi:hypothetical protein